MREAIVVTPGYFGSFQAWTCAKDAFDKWPVQMAQRVALLRGVGGRRSSPLSPSHTGGIPCVPFGALCRR
jgi:hypothetical protein